MFLNFHKKRYTPKYTPKTKSTRYKINKKLYCGYLRTNMNDTFTLIKTDEEKR